MKLNKFILLGIFFLAAISHAEVPLTKEQLDEIERHQKSAAESRKSAARLEQMADQVESFSRARNVACQKSFGSRVFCECLGNKLPYSVSFKDYIFITTIDMDDFTKLKLSKDDLLIFDRTIDARNECVGIR